MFTHNIKQKLFEKLPRLYKVGLPQSPKSTDYTLESSGKSPQLVSVVHPHGVCQQLLLISSKDK